jgi:nitroreductase
VNEIVRKRKSTRKYDHTPLDAATLDAVRSELEMVKPLFPDVKYSIEITNTIKGAFKLKAPHYLVFGSEAKDGACENIGFIGQQLDLYFSANGIGSCWLGLSKPGEDVETNLPYVIAMSFGKPVGSLHRELSDFKRKPLEAISEGNDSRLEAARLAPSGANMQNWYFVAEGEKIHCYLKKPKPLIGMMFDRLSRIDIGIAICHIAQESKNFSFVKQPDALQRKGYEYTGTVTQL